LATVTATVAAVCPVAVAERVAVELRAAAAVAATVTVCPVFQFAGVNVSEAGVAETVVAPAVRAIATVVFAVGALDRATLKVTLSPGATVSEVASATTAGAVEGSTNAGTSAVALFAPVES
jgi:hypothetical protein